MLGLVSEKMTDRVVVVRQEEERRVSQETVTPTILEEEIGEEEDKEDDEVTVDDREICKVTDVTEEDFETTEGENVDFLLFIMNRESES